MAAVDATALDLRRRGTVIRGARLVGTYVRMHPVPFVVAVSGASLYAAATVGSTIVLGRVTDSVLAPALSHGVSHGVLAGGVVAIVAVAVLKAAGIVVRRYFAGMTQARVHASLQRRLADRYTRYALSWCRGQNTGELLAHAESDVQAATEVLQPLPYSTAVILMLLFALVAMLVTDLFLAMVGLTILPALALLNRLFATRVEPLSRAVQEQVGGLSSVAHESIDGAVVVKTLGRERDEVERFAAAADDLRTARVRLGRLRAVYEPLLDTLPDLGIVLVLAVGAWRVSSGAISTGTLVQFASLFQLLAFPVRLIGFTLEHVPRSLVGIARLDEVDETARVLPAPSQPEGLPPGPLGLRVSGVSHGFGGEPVLRDLSFSVEPGETVALVGTTGSGKSTLLELLVRLDDPVSGSVAVGGVDVRGLDPVQLHTAVALAFQEPFLLAATVRENITLGRDLADADVRRAAAVAQADGFIAELPQGYDTVLGERGVSLSGGQRQRVALARALAGRPRVLLLDDATSAVDPTVEAAILAGLSEQRDTTVLVVAHRLSTIRLADRIVVLAGGRIEVTGRHDELRANRVYRSIVRAYTREVAA